jgi:hypothetical protein
MELSEEGLSGFFSTTFPLVNERQRRLMAAAMVEVLGRGGQARVAEATGMSRNTLIAGAAELARHRVRAGALWDSRATAVLASAPPIWRAPGSEDGRIAQPARRSEHRRPPTRQEAPHVPVPDASTAHGSSAAPSRRIHSSAMARPFGRSSPGLQRHAVTMASMRIQHAQCLVDSIHDRRQPVAGQIRLPHACVQPFERARLLLRRDVVRRHGSVVGPQRHREVVLLLDPRLAPRIEYRQLGPRLGKAPSDLELELGAVLAGARCETSEDVTRLKVLGKPVRIAQHERVIDAQTTCGGYRPANGHCSRNLRCVHGRHSRESSAEGGTSSPECLYGA